MRRRSYHYPHRSGHLRGPFGPLLLVLGAVVLAGATTVVLMLVTMLLILGPLLLVGGAAIAARRWRHRRAMAWQDRTVAGRAAAPVARPQPLPPVPDWAATRARFARLRSEYGHFECDPLAVLRLPALTDVTVASTGRFVDAFAEAQALDSDTEPPPAHRARFAAAVDQAWRAWHAALDAAERIRLAGIPAEERASVQRAIKLLTMARDSDNDAERAAAYSRARAELAKLDRAGILRLPPAAAAALDAAARGQLPPASARADSAG